MSKKNRFDMLEVDKQSNHKKAKKVDDTPLHAKKEKREFKVIIEDDAFENNLEKVKLKQQKKDIKFKKKEIAKQVEVMKLHAYWKIILGCIIILTALRKFVTSEKSRKLRSIGVGKRELIETQTDVFLSKENIINGILIIIGVYLLSSVKEVLRERKK